MTTENTVIKSTHEQQEGIIEESKDMKIDIHEEPFGNENNNITQDISKD